MNLRKVRLRNVAQHLRRPIDLFICSGSFETRSRAIATALNRELVRKAVVLEAVDLKDYTEPTARFLKGLFTNTGVIVRVSTRDPLFSADNLAKSLHRYIHQNEVKRILIDITSFTHELLLILLRILQIHFLSAPSKPEIVYAYTGASDYSIGDAVKYKWLSKGVQDVRSVLGYPGDSFPTRKTHLTILVGYEWERALKLIEKVEPNSISLGFGKAGTQTTEKNKNANRHFHLLLKRLAASYAIVDNFEFSCNNPIETCNTILRIARSRAGNNILLAPMNNKMSTLGAALAAFSLPEIQVCYASVVEYNFQNYSTPGQSCYFLTLPELMSP